MTAVRRTPSGGYAQEWSAYDKAQVGEKQLFQTLLRELCLCVDEPEQLTGRPRLPLRDMIFSVVFKVYSTFAARRFMTDLREAHAKGMIRKVPHYNALSRYLRLEPMGAALTRLIEISSLPLEPFEEYFAVDSTGFGTKRYTRWVDERTLGEKAKREWVKLHLSCGVRTNIVTSVLVTSRRENDSPFFCRLVAAAAKNFRVKEVSADKGYLSSENMRQALLLGAAPFIPFRSNCYLDANLRSTVWKRMLCLYKYRHQEFAAHYNKRNNVETTFSMIKAKFGDRLRSKDTQAQFNEALCKVLCHNVCVIIQSMYELGLTPEFSADMLTRADSARPVGPIGGGRIVAGVTGISHNRQAEEFDGRERKGAKPKINPNQLSLFEEKV